VLAVEFEAADAALGESVQQRFAAAADELARRAGLS
jgi:hypothetical protein